MGIISENIKLEMIIVKHNSRVIIYFMEMPRKKTHFYQAIFKLFCFSIVSLYYIWSLFLKNFGRGKPTYINFWPSEPSRSVT